MLPGIYSTFQHWGDEGAVWIYSDPHFSDEELSKGIKGRPSAEEQVKLINSKAGRKDTLIVLGDVGNVEWVKKLRARYKILIMGNHDAGASNYRQLEENRLFDEVYEGALIVGEKLILSHEPIEIPFMFNIHGHEHRARKRPNHLNVCSDVINYTPVNLNQLLKSGLTSKVTSIHRAAINTAVARKK